MVALYALKRPLFNLACLAENVLGKLIRPLAVVRLLQRFYKIFVHNFNFLSAYKRSNTEAGREESRSCLVAAPVRSAPNCYSKATSRICKQLPVDNLFASASNLFYRVAMTDNTEEAASLSGQAFGKLGGLATKKKHGNGFFAKLSRLRWDRHHGKVCLNCGLYKDHIEKKKIPCIKYIDVVVRKKQTFPKHVYNVPVKKSRAKK